MNILLSTTYFGPIQYYSKLLAAEKVVLERFEHFPKQTWRNRCLIYGANGSQTISIPINKGGHPKVFTKDLRIDYSLNWPKVHFKAIESAYRCSPFYEYYMDDLAPFFEKRYNFLYDFNLELMNTLCRLIGFTPNVTGTDDYWSNFPESWLDLRNTIHPKMRMSVPDERFIAPVYRQVFEPKLGFVGNLSILDLLFNTGTNALLHLKESIQ
jgi:hypothetical protein